MKTDEGALKEPMQQIHSILYGRLPAVTFVMLVLVGFKMDTMGNCTYKTEMAVFRTL